MTKKNRAQKLYDRARKIDKWTIRAEEAITRDQALKALRKVAKHSIKLAKLQQKAYDSTVPKEDFIHDEPTGRRYNFFRGI
jgi:hypothetical protein